METAWESRLSTSPLPHDDDSPVMETMLPDHPLIHPVTLTLPHLPAALQGLRLAHLTDLHFTRMDSSPGQRLLESLMAQLEVDLVLLTGDYMTNPGHEQAAEAAMRRLCDILQPRLGVYGVMGNHDTPELRRSLACLPVRWLHDQVHHLADLPLEIVGMRTLRHTWPDSLAMLQHRRQEIQKQREKQQDNPPDAHRDRPFRLMLCHHPTYLPVAADLGVDLMLSGHTHGGQCRLPGKRAIINSTDYPMRLTSGILRHRDTLGLVSRGLGEVHLPWRLFCPRQLPVYTLRQGPLIGQACSHIVNHEVW